MDLGYGIYSLFEIVSAPDDWIESYGQVRVKFTASLADSDPDCVFALLRIAGGDSLTTDRLLRVKSDSDSLQAGAFSLTDYQDQDRESIQVISRRDSHDLLPSSLQSPSISCYVQLSGHCESSHGLFDSRIFCHSCSSLRITLVGWCAMLEIRFGEFVSGEQDLDSLDRRLSSIRPCNPETQCRRICALCHLESRPALIWTHDSTGRALETFQASFSGPNLSPPPARSITGAHCINESLHQHQDQINETNPLHTNHQVSLIRSTKTATATGCCCRCSHLKVSHLQFQSGRNTRPT